MGSRIIYKHEPANRFVVGTVGVPGERAFFLQISSVFGLTSVAVEKTQVLALAERLNELIAEVRRGQLASLDELGLAKVVDNAPLEFPIDEDFRAGIMAIAWDSARNLIAIEIQGLGDEYIEEIVPEDEIDIEDAPDLVKFTIRIYQARGFIERAKSLVNSGRQPCPFCALPIDQNGHLCPRSNGYRR